MVPFHHSVLHDGGLSNLVLGYAHCGMVAAARWIAKLSVPCLIKALDENPGYKVQVMLCAIGDTFLVHSLLLRFVFTTFSSVSLYSTRCR